MLEIDIYILLAQIINFGILYYIFKRFIADKLNSSIAKRKENEQKLAHAEEFYKSRVALAEQHQKDLLKEARQTSAALMKESETITNEKAKIILEQAHSDAIAILEGGKREIEKERLSMLVQMKKHILDVSLKLNEKMFGEGKTSREFLEQELEKMK